MKKIATILTLALGLSMVANVSAQISNSKPNTPVMVADSEGHGGGKGSRDSEGHGGGKGPRIAENKTYTA